MHKQKPGQNVKVYLHAQKSHFPPLPLPPLISLLPLFLPSPMPYNSPSSPLLTLLLPQPLSPLIYHCQYDPLTLPKTTNATPPSLLSKYHYHLLDCLNLYIHNECWPLIPTRSHSPSLIYQLSLHVGVASSWNRENTLWNTYTAIINTPQV